MTLSFELTPLDRQFARFLCSEAGGATDLLELLAALVSNGVGLGHVCLQLGEVAGKTVMVDGREHEVPPLKELTKCLGSLEVVGPPGAYVPLILDKDRLYLQRYWYYERQLSDVILDKAAVPAPGIDISLLRGGIAKLFPGNGVETDWQKVAAAAALLKRFLVISGGPGTGKTSTVVKIIALLLEQAKGRPLGIALAAPTGKAAARLGDTIRSMKGGLHCDDAILRQIPEDVSTIHRLLGPLGSGGRFRFNRDNLLPFDAVIVDEASMVPLPMMARLTAAMKGEASLILLGDRDQLASVEAGAVLGDICGGSGEEPFSPGFATAVSDICGFTVPPLLTGAPLLPLADSLVVLKRNYRFAAESGIGSVCAAVRDGDGAKALSIMTDETVHDVYWREAPAPEGLRRSLAGIVVEGFTEALRAPSPMEALAAMERFRILCALRRGPYGVEGVNAVAEGILAAEGLIYPTGRWYHGRPIMVTVNDYNLRLFNGDVGIVCADPDADGALRAFFPAPDGGVRRLPPVRLPAHETVFAMTVHKSQGSEFDRVLLILPPADSELLTRELVYTAITRARSGVEIWGDEKVFTAAVERRTLRKSGLRDALWPQI